MELRQKHDDPEDVDDYIKTRKHELEKKISEMRTLGYGQRAQDYEERLDEINLMEDELVQ